MTPFLRSAAAAALAAAAMVGLGLGLAVAPAAAQGSAETAIPEGAVGAVDFVQGPAIARAPGGPDRPLTKGAGIARGDTVITGAAGRVQMRFVDGGYLSIYANTEFLIEDYFYAGAPDGNENVALRLVQGGLRALTGAIGKNDPQKYSVTTIAGSIGIRGTGYTATMDDGLSASVSEGAIAMVNQVGEIILRPGQTGYMANATTPPALIQQRPYLPPTPPATRTAATTPAPPAPPAFRPAETRDDEGRLEVLPSVHGDHHDHSHYQQLTGLGYTQVGTAHTGMNAAFALNTADVRDSSVVYIDSGNVNSWDWDRGDAMGRGAKGITDVGASGPVSWSRWTEGMMVYQTYASDTWYTYPADYNARHAHVIVGAPATAVPTTGSADYTLAGGTSPVLVNAAAGSAGTLTSGTLRVDFASQRVGLEMALSQGGTAWGITTPGGLASTAASGMRLTSQGDSGLTGDHYFYGNSPGGPAYTVAISRNGAACADCFGQVRGFLSGAEASHAGLTYIVSPSATDFYANNSVSGAAAFAKVTAPD